MGFRFFFVWNSSRLAARQLIKSSQDHDFGLFTLYSKRDSPRAQKCVETVKYQLNSILELQKKKEIQKNEKSLKAKSKS
jgi:hypothetical protein